MSIINAKQEFLNCTKNLNIIAVDISFDGSDTDFFKLKPLYTNDEYEKLLVYLDHDYNNGYGGQELYGIIYCEGGIWIDRGRI